MQVLCSHACVHRELLFGQIRIKRHRQASFTLFCKLVCPVVDLLVADLVLVCNLTVIATGFNALPSYGDSFLKSCLSCLGHTASSCCSDFYMTIIHLNPHSELCFFTNLVFTTNFPKTARPSLIIHYCGFPQFLRVLFVLTFGEERLCSFQFIPEYQVPDCPAVNSNYFPCHGIAFVPVDIFQNCCQLFFRFVPSLLRYNIPPQETVFLFHCLLWG